MPTPLVPCRKFFTPENPAPATELAPRACSELAPTGATPLEMDFGEASQHSLRWPTTLPPAPRCHIAPPHQRVRLRARLHRRAENPWHDRTTSADHRPSRDSLHRRGGPGNPPP